MGAAQIGKVMQRIGEYAAIAERNPEFWEEVDHVVVDRMGLPLEKE